MTDKELHLIVLWPKAREQQDKIIADVSSKLQILECVEIAWTPSNAANNYTRFYNFSEKSGKRKAEICGPGNPLLITVLDNDPNYRIVESNRGFEYLNYNLFELKLKYRDMFEGLHVVHTTNNSNEVKHDLCMLLGISAKDYLSSAPKSWDGKIRSIKKDLAGCNGYDSFEEMFYVLNETVNYAVLRNYEMLPHEFNTDYHGDIDIICERYSDICNILNAKPQKHCKERLYNTVSGQKIPYDIRYLGDDYYCYNFEKDMLGTRIINEKGVSVLSDEYYFYSLIYHALYQKKYVSPDYYEKLYNLFCKLGFDKKYNLNDYISPFDLYFILLKDFMKKHNYNFCNFKKNILYNDYILHVDDQIKYLETHYRFNNVKSCKIDEKAPQNYKFFDGYFEGRHVFIKTGGYDKLCKNEFKMMEKVYGVNNENFVKPLFYRCVNDEQNIVMEYLDGKSLEYLLKNNKVTDELKKKLVKDIENIARTLRETQIVNRNIKPSNIILASDSHFKLIDFRFAVNMNNYKEFDCLKKSTDVLENLGSDFSLKKYCWDDFYSLSLILNLLNIRSKYIEDNIGRLVIKLKGKHGRQNKFIQKIFSVGNEFSHSSQRKYKVLHIMGIKIKFKRKV